MFKCNECKHDFEDVAVISTSYERMYGVEGLFFNSNPIDIETCPYCGSQDFIKVEDDEDY